MHYVLSNDHEHEWNNKYFRFNIIIIFKYLTVMTKYIFRLYIFINWPATTFSDHWVVIFKQLFNCEHVIVWIEPMCVCVCVCLRVYDKNLSQDPLTPECHLSERWELVAPTGASTKKCFVTKSLTPCHTKLYESEYY